MSFSAAAVDAGLVTRPGKQAIKGSHRASIDIRNGARFTHSVELDEAFAEVEPHAPRWDYGVGVSHGIKEYAIWIEPHGASSTSEVTRVLAKLRWLREKLKSPEWQALKSLTDSAIQDSVQAFWWVVPQDGTVCFSPDSPQARQLKQSGLKMPAKSVKLP